MCASGLLGTAHSGSFLHTGRRDARSSSQSHVDLMYRGVCRKLGSISRLPSVEG